MARTLQTGSVELLHLMCDGRSRTTEDLVAGLKQVYRDAIDDRSYSWFDRWIYRIILATGITSDTVKGAMESLQTEGCITGTTGVVGTWRPKDIRHATTWTLTPAGGRRAREIADRSELV